MKGDERHEPGSRPEQETEADVWRAVGRLLARQRDGEPADAVESGALLRRMRRVR